MNRDHLIFETIVGSRAYGTARPDSDEDIKGVYVEPRSSLLTLSELPEQHSDERGDVVYYSLRRFIGLAFNANPNIIELLFMPEDCIRHTDPVFRQVLEMRDMFITKQAYTSHVRYAQAQIKKARGQNKWVNNPQPEARPGPKDFCWIVPADRGNAMPYRPIPLEQSKIDLSGCDVASVEHTPNLYRLYEYGDDARGVFRGDAIVCEPIPIDDEIRRCIGLLIFNEHAYEQAIRDHRNYWTWRKNRNEKRWQTQESGQLDYDAKNMMHMFRLMLSAESILKEGRPLVRFTGDKLTYLLSILEGRFTYDEIISEANELTTRLDAFHKISQLPEEPDHKKAESLLVDVTVQWEAIHA